MLLKVLMAIFGSVPWETVVAMVFRQVFDRLLVSKNATDIERARRFVSKVAEQTIVLTRYLDDGDLSSGEVRELFEAWAEQKPTPQQARASALGVELPLEG